MWKSIINRILKLSSKGENPSSFLVLTFDKAASISLKEKLNEALKENNITINEQPNISTLNAFGYYILRNQLKRGNEIYYSDLNGQIKIEKRVYNNSISLSLISYKEKFDTIN